MGTELYWLMVEGRWFATTPDGRKLRLNTYQVYGNKEGCSLELMTDRGWAVVETCEADWGHGVATPDVKSAARDAAFQKLRNAADYLFF